MTVKELMELLSYFPQDRVVLLTEGDQHRVPEGDIVVSFGNMVGRESPRMVPALDGDFVYLSLVEGP
jgi:hypothetical protein